MFFFLAAIAFAKCPNLQTELDTAREFILYDKAEEAATLLANVEAGFACAPAYPDQLSRYWLLKGTVAQMTGKPEEATPYFAAARRLSPEPDLQLGPVVVGAFKVAESPGTAQLNMQPAIPAWVDGKEESTWPLTLSAGPHLVQVRSDDDRVLYSNLLDIPVGQTALLETKLPASLARKKKLPFPVYMVGGILLAGAGGATAWGAMQQDPIIESEYNSCVNSPNNCDEAAFRGAGLRGDLFSIGSYALWTIGAAGITAQFVLPTDVMGWNKSKKKTAPPPENPTDPAPVDPAATTPVGTH